MIEVGDIVHYVLKEGPRSGECRPAMVVRVQDPATDTVVLEVFTDGLSDGPFFHNPQARLTARIGAPGEPGRLHTRGSCIQPGGALLSPSSVPPHPSHG